MLKKYNQAIQKFGRTLLLPIGSYGASRYGIGNYGSSSTKLYDSKISIFRDSGCQHDLSKYQNNCEYYL